MRSPVAAGRVCNWCSGVFLGVQLSDVCLCPADIRMSKAAEEEKPGADYPGDSSGTTHSHTAVTCFQHVSPSDNDTFNCIVSSTVS